MLAMSSFPLILLLFLSLISISFSQSPLRGKFINCGATVPVDIDGREWQPDGTYITSGTGKNVTVPVLTPILSTVRSFPLQNNLRRKFCYVVDVFRGAKYMVRTTYFYGGVNGNVSPPVFDQIIDGTLWSIVNTTDDYLKGLSTYYEGVFLARGKTMSVCVAANSYTTSDPFISSLEFVILGNSLYNSTDFRQFGLALVSRNSFGHNGRVRYPDDLFDRFWEPFGKNDSTITVNQNLSVGGIWNLPPAKVFETELTSNVTEPLELNWPSGSLSNEFNYSIALYFADNRNSSQGGPRFLSVTINNITYYKNLSVSSEGEVVYASRWPLAGVTKLVLKSLPGSSVGPLINAGEVFSMMPLGNTTLTRDVIALGRLKSSFQNPPQDWNGDPCMPSKYSWTGVTCSEGSRIRVTALNLTSMGLSGTLSPSIARLSALTDIWLGNNSLSGSIPDIGSLRMLKTLHMEDNKLSGVIPASLGNITGLSELFLQNNNLTGQIPSTLIGKPGLDFRFTGNPLLSPPAS